ncbi:MAG: 50S ribosomal protein L11 methyltransferase [Nitrospirae bacterium]|nr:50S ribosomal protein L11 methyltransferase [Nitrospirota bacterium]
MQKQDATSDSVDVQLSSTIDAGELLAELDDPDVQSGWQDDDTIHLYWPSRSWSPNHLVRLRQTLRQLDGVDGPEILVQALPDQDWNKVWAQSVKPLWIGKRIVITPSWETVAVRPDLSGGQSFDFVPANIDRQTLFELADRLAGRTRARLLVSGLLVDQREESVAAFAATGHHCEWQRERDGWLALEFIPAQPCDGSA